MLFLVTGPPAAGKSTWVRQNAKSGDITIDYDAIAAVLTPLQEGVRAYPKHVSAVTQAARRAAIDTAIEYRESTDVYVIHSTPSEKMIKFYQRLGAKIVTVDPGRDVVLSRCDKQRPWQMKQVANRWYQDRNPNVVVPESVAMPW
jgi:hypothetical protein